MKKICYEYDEIINSARKLFYILLSIRNIGDYSIDHPEIDLGDELRKFILQEGVLDLLAEIREVIEMPFEDYPRTGDFSFLEKIYEDISLWEGYKKCSGQA